MRENVGSSWCIYFLMLKCFSVGFVTAVFQVQEKN